jgi:hypothetical protein
MAYDWLISKGEVVPFEAAAEINAGEWVKGSTGADTVIPATAGSDALGMAAITAYDEATPSTRNKQVSVYMSGVVKAYVHATSDVNVGDNLEIESKTTLTVSGGSNPVVAMALDYLESGETDYIRVRIDRKTL